MTVLRALFDEREHAALDAAIDAALRCFYCGERGCKHIRIPEDADPTWSRISRPLRWIKPLSDEEIERIAAA